MVLQYSFEEVSVNRKICVVYYLSSLISLNHSPQNTNLKTFPYVNLNLFLLIILTTGLL